MNTILLTGGTGKTGRRIAAKLVEKGKEVRVASRSGAHVDGCQSVLFDWKNESAFSSALNNVDRVYLLAPTDTVESLDAMQPFIDYAIKNGVIRFVLLSATSLPKGGPMMGAVHQYLEENAQEWTILRPTWFMQNFSEQQHLQTILREDAIYSATGEGRVPFIDTNDIANVATVALTNSDAFNNDFLLTGPHSISYDDVAHLISDKIGRRIVHKKLSVAELEHRFLGLGMGEDYAHGLASMDRAIASGTEDSLYPNVELLTGKVPNDFKSFAAVNKQVWLSKTN